MRNGFTTGSCAAAASKAAAYMLFSGCDRDMIRIITPAGVPYETALLDRRIEGDSARCAVKKDAGDDPDITNGMLIYAHVTRVCDGAGRVEIRGGTGVGTVTRDGLDQPKGNAAINSVPRRMIEKEVRQVAELYDIRDSLVVTISVPEGEKIAGKTFNPKLGIEGGISIIGTSGIVEPMSVKAILDTIGLELKQKRAEGRTGFVAAPGNYGLQFVRDTYGYDLDRAVKCSNYIGDTIDMAGALGFREMLLVGHIGKLIKLSGGIMNTHSKEADGRMELMALAAFFCGAEKPVAERILGCNTTEEAYEVLVETGYAKEALACIMERIGHYLKRRAGEELHVECILFSNRYGILGSTPGADAMMERVKEND